MGPCDNNCWKEQQMSTIILRLDFGRQIGVPTYRKENSFPFYLLIIKRHWTYSAIAATALHHCHCCYYHYHPCHRYCHYLGTFIVTLSRIKIMRFDDFSNQHPLIPLLFNGCRKDVMVFSGISANSTIFLTWVPNFALHHYPCRYQRRFLFS